MPQEFEYLDIIICGYTPSGAIWEVRSYTKMVPVGKWQAAYSWAVEEAMKLNRKSENLIFRAHKYGVSGSLDQYVADLLAKVRKNQQALPW